MSSEKTQKPNKKNKKFVVKNNSLKQKSDKIKNKGTGAGGDVYYQSRTGHHFYSGGTALGNNCLSLTGSGICTLKYLGSDRLVTTAAGVTVTGAVTATSFVKTGGTSSQYLMADGSVSTAGVGINEDRGSFNELDAALFS